MNITSPWISTAEVAERLRMFDQTGAPDRLAARRWLDYHHVDTKYAGRRILARREDVDAALVTRKEWPRAATTRRAS